MTIRTFNSIIVPAVVAVYFGTGFRLITKDAPQSVFYTFTVYLLSVAAVSLFVRFCWTPLLNRYILPLSKKNDTAGAVFLTGIMFAAFLFLYFWWYNTGIQSWTVPFFSLQNLLMAAGAFFIAFACGRIHRQHMRPAKTAKTGSTKKQPFQPETVFCILVLITLRILLGSAAWTGVESRPPSPSHYDNGRTVVMICENISLNEVVTESASGNAQQLSMLIGASVVGVLSDSAESAPEGQWTALLSGHRDKGASSAENSSYTAYAVNIDSLRRFTVADFFRSLLFMTDNAAIAPLREPGREPEPVWDTAIRYHAHVAVINFPYSQRTGDGIYISAESIRDGVRSKRDIVPDSLRERVYSFDNTIGEAAESPYSRTSSTTEAILRHGRPDILFVRLDFGGNPDPLSNIRQIDNITGLIRSNQPDRMVLIGLTGESRQDSFVLYSGPFLHRTEKVRNISRGGIYADLLYILGLPNLNGEHATMNEPLYHPARLKAAPPKFVDHYPPLEPLY